MDGAPTLAADFRERDSPIVTELARQGRVGIAFRRLRAGDYAFGALLGVEAKTAVDFAKSIVDGRLFRQASALARSVPRPLVLVVGGVGAGVVAGVAGAAIRGAVVSLSVVFGIPVVSARDPAEAAEVLAFAAIQAARRPTRAYARPGYRPRGLRARRLYVLQGLPLVGPVRAARLLDRFGSVGRAMTATARELRGVEGVGSRVTEAILRVAGDGTPVE